jgi:hypothetical protein
MRQVNEWTAVGAAFLVLFTAMLEPLMSTLLAAIFLVALVACELQRPRVS